MLSVFTMVLTFILLYVPASHFFETTALYDNHFSLFLILILLLYPTHKFFHYLPIIHLGPKIKKSIDWKFKIYPLISIRVQEPIAKSLFMTALLMPFVAISLMLIVAYFLFPHYVHYITILIAYQIGISVPDLICARTIIMAPRHSFIEENDDGYEILVSRN